MNDEITRALVQSIKDLKLKGNAEVKPVIIRLEQLLKQRRVKRGIKKA